MFSSMTTRPDWDEYFLQLASAVSVRADCTRSKVGAVLVDSFHRVLSVGYNGAPSGATGCLTAGACPRGRLSYDELPPLGDYGTCIAIHAESNAILFADPKRRKGSVLYITRSPCTGCHQLILKEGIKEIVWRGPDQSICKERQFH